MPRPRRLLSLSLLALLCGTWACGGGGPSFAERAAAARAAEEAADAKAREETRAKLEAERLAALWRYQEATIGGGSQITASIFTTEGVDVDGRGPQLVQLVFRDHQKWGRSAYLVLQSGDFACRPRCTVGVTADEGATAPLAAWRPDTDEAIALFVRDSAALWQSAGAAARLRVEFPVAAGGTRVAAFEVAGLDTSRMPGW